MKVQPENDMNILNRSLAEIVFFILNGSNTWNSLLVHVLLTHWLTLHLPYKESDLVMMTIFQATFNTKLSQIH